MRRYWPEWMGLWVRDSSIVLSSQALTMVLTTVLAVILARELGPSQFGLLAALQGVALILTVFVDAGIGTYLLRELSGLWGGERPSLASARSVELVSNAFGATAAAAALLVSGSMVVTAAMSSDAELALTLGALVGYSAFLACADSLEAVYRAQRRLRTLASMIVIEKVLLVAFVGAALLADGGILGIAAGYVSAASCRVVLDVVVVRRLGLLRWRWPKPRRVARILRGSLPFGIGSSAPTALVRLDSTLIGLVSTTDAGLFAVGDRILTALLVLPSTSATTLYPILARADSSFATARRAAGLMFAVGAALAVVGIVLAPSVVPYVFGSSYADAVTPVQLMLLAAPVVYASSMMMTGLYSVGRERLVLFVMLTCTVAGSALVITGELVFGVNGAAAGYTLRFLGLFLGLGVASLRTQMRFAHTSGAAATSR